MVKERRLGSEPLMPTTITIRPGDTVASRAERDAEIIRLRHEGMTLGAIAKRVGLSVDRLRIILAVAARREIDPMTLPPYARVHRFAPSERVGHVIYEAVLRTYGEAPDDLTQHQAAAAVARLSRAERLTIPCFPA
jgi:hypothetical protein